MNEKKVVSILKETVSFIEAVVDIVSNNTK